MSLDVAPYNTAMRIGQGFNSYTHEILINDAVVVDDAKPGGDHFTADATRVSQMVTYCTRYVDKMSQVTDAMSVSAALSIKSASAGGGASGSYVDSDKFKESDINFFVQVKVTNQVIMAEDVTKYQHIDGISGAEFNKIFGDCFISGFIEGGELDAIISIKMKEGSNATDIKAALEANFGKGVSADIKGDGSKEHLKTFKDTETTITVNWCGGGNIKPKQTFWSIESLTQAAAEFPQNVAECPQRIYAILTKYTALRSFQMQQPRINPLQYENASLYTNDLLDAYMDYRNIWKDIHTSTVALEFNQITLSIAPEFKRQKTKARQQNPMDFLDEVVSYVENAGDKSHAEHMKDIRAKLTKPDYREHEGQAYEPTILGLEKARKDCRIEMLKIVNEVDAVTLDPTLALQQDRDCGYLNPAVFRRLLPQSTPVLKSTSTDQTLKITEAAKSDKQVEFYTGTPSKELPALAKAWVDARSAPQKEGYQMSSFAGDHSEHEAGKFVSMLDNVNKASMVSKIEVWLSGRHVAALRVGFKGGPYPSLSIRDIPANEAPQVFEVPNGSKITSVIIHAGEGDFDSTKVVYGLTLTTDRNISKFIGTPRERLNKVEEVPVQVPQAGWSLKGFWSDYGAALDRVGVIWGKDEPVQTNGI